MGSFTATSATSSTSHTTEVLRGLYENTKWVHTALPAQSLEAPKSKIDLKRRLLHPQPDLLQTGCTLPLSAERLQ